MNPDKKLEAYNTHYKESFELVKAAQTRRNKNFVILCILEAMSFMIVYNSDLVFLLLNEKVRKELESEITLGNGVLQTLIWILCAYVVIRYVQDMLYIERQYSYIDGLEKKIKVLMGENDTFDREGENYARNYPIVLNLIDLFYKMFCPILFLGINIAHIVFEWQQGGKLLPLVVDTLIFAVITIIVWFYYFEIHSKTTEWFKSKVPFIKKISEKLHVLLKEV